MSTTEVSKDVVRRFAETFSTMQYDDWGELLADDATYEFPGEAIVSGVFTKAEMIEKVKGIPYIFPAGIQLEIRSMTAEEDRISVEAQGSAVSIEGVPYNNRYHMMFVIRDGRIKTAREYCDTKLADKLFGPFMGG